MQKIKMKKIKKIIYKKLIKIILMLMKKKKKKSRFMSMDHACLIQVNFYINFFYFLKNNFNNLQNIFYK